jgi:hypothetical protein
MLLRGSASTYALCGGLALAAHGEIAECTGLELMIPAADSKRLHAVATVLGLQLMPEPPRLDGSEWCWLMAVRDDMMTVDILLVTPLTSEAWEGQKRLQWLDREVAVLDPADARRYRHVRHLDRDMSDEAIARRIALASHLRSVALTLAAASAQN